jgi:hypothetical protein
MYDETMVRNQDDELSFRLRKNGGKIVQSSKIKIIYYPRSNLKDLFKQFSQYGFWKVAVIKRHPAQASIRHFAPVVLLICLISFGIGSLLHFNIIFGFVTLISSYIIAIAIESIRIAINTELKLLSVVFTAIITIHFSFGIGFIMGIICNLFKLIPRWFITISR